MTLCGNDSSYPIRGGGNGTRAFPLLLELLEKFAPVAVDQIFSSKIQTSTHNCRVTLASKNGTQSTFRIFSVGEADIPPSRSRERRTTIQRVMNEVIASKKRSEECPCGELPPDVSFGDCVAIVTAMSRRNRKLQEYKDGQLDDKRDTKITVGNTLRLGEKDFELSTVIFGCDRYSDDGSRSGGHEWAQIRRADGQVRNIDNSRVTKVKRSKLETNTTVMMAIYTVRTSSHPDPFDELRILRQEKEIQRQEKEIHLWRKELLRWKTLRWATLRQEKEIERLTTQTISEPRSNPR